MKHLLLYSAAILLAAISCTNEDMVQETGTGKAKMQFAVSTSPVQIITRATAIPDEEKFIIRVTDAEGEEQLKDTLRLLQMESPLYLPAADEGTKYTIEAYSNEKTESKAVLDKPCFYASKDTLIYPDETITVDLVCALQQFQVSFEPSETFLNAFRDDTMVEEQGGDNFELTVSDANNRSVSYKFSDLNKSAYFDGNQSSAYIKIHVTGTTIKGFPVDYTETIEPEDGSLVAKDHLIISLDVKAAETKSFTLKAAQIEL